MKDRQKLDRTGSDRSVVRAVPPKMFATDGTERHPVAVYNFFFFFFFFAGKRSEKII